MRVEIKNYMDNWMNVKETTLTTISKDKGKYPSSSWKTKLLRCEHSPIRNIIITGKFYDLPYWVSTHFVRHSIGCTWFVETQRTDRTGEDRNEKSQNALVNMSFTLNAQAIINISRKRLCCCASRETRDAWRSFLFQLKDVEPELYNLCVPECQYRNYCPEMFLCDYSKSDHYNDTYIEYRNYNGEEEKDE